MHNKVIICKIKIVLLIFFSFSFISCVSTETGANWWVKDFGTEDKNYKDFDTSILSIGMTEQELHEKLTIPYTISEMTNTYKVLRYEKWRAVAGSDYVEQVLSIKITNNILSEFKIINETVKTNPW